VTRVSPGELASLPESDRAGLEQIVGGEYGQLIDNEYRQGLQDSADISVL
jgi:peptidyl-prolyl cis-trans isomerase D